MCGQLEILNAMPTDASFCWLLLQHFVRVEVQYDTVMRFIKFTTNHGRDAGWGFPNVKGAFTNVTAAPTPGSYLAAIWGQEGKQLPPAQGGYKKRCVKAVL